MDSAEFIAHESIRVLRAWAAGAMLILLPAAKAAEAPVAADTYVSSAAPGANFGAAENLAIGNGNTGLIAFDLSAYAPGTTVTKAWLRLFVNSVTAGGTLSLSVLNSSWTESLVTWGTQPSVASAFAGIAAGANNAFLMVDVTTQVEAWIAAPAANFGFQITAPQSVLVNIDSKENTQSSHQAVLDLVVAATGPMGPQGTTGTTGAAGVSGTTGLTGPIGPAGPAGEQGPQGAAGPAGSIGSTGATGPVGPAGPAGSAGPAGATGAQGAQGLTGPAGATGATGAAGPAGPAGPAGATGPAGAIGPAGSAGAAGATGATGLVSGGAGPTGTAGAVGQQGPQGAQGSRGITGPAGVTGASGAAGAAGGNGPTGNVFLLDTTAHAGTYTIPNTDTNIYYIGDNTSATATFLLPTGQQAGRRLVILEKVASLVSPGLKVEAQNTDTLITDASGNATSLTANYVIQLFADGNGHWYVTYYQ